MHRPRLLLLSLAAALALGIGEALEAARTRAAEDFGWNIVALLHSTEIPVPGSLPRCIRLLVHAYTTRPRDEIRHVYLRDAVSLRPDRA